ncbi:SCP-like extracellular [Paenibacillus sp. MMS18-CY102]|nr:SCP-like extracellular [Paenibacillus sp. MMS18-CY102]
MHKVDNTPNYTTKSTLPHDMNRSASPNYTLKSTPNSSKTTQASSIATKGSSLKSLSTPQYGSQQRWIVIGGNGAGWGNLGNIGNFNPNNPGSYPSYPGNPSASYPTNPTPSKPSTPSTPAPSTPSTNAPASANATKVLQLVNTQRKNAGLPALTMDSALANMALVKAKDMINNNYFSHNSPTYGSPFDMMAKFGITYRTAGENIAKGQQSPEQVMNDWMNSPGHRANILKNGYTKLGVGYYNGAWVQEFTG